VREAAELRRRGSRNRGSGHRRLKLPDLDRLRFLRRGEGVPQHHVLLLGAVDGVAVGFESVPAQHRAGRNQDVLAVLSSVFSRKMPLLKF